MIPTSLNLQHNKGADFLDTLVITDDAGDPIDLNGATGTMYIKARFGDVTPVLEITTANGRMVFDTQNSQIIFNCRRALWASITPDLYIYSLRITFDESPDRDDVPIEGIFDLGESAV